MESTFTWIVLFLLGFIPCKVTADLQQFCDANYILMNEAEDNIETGNAMTKNKRRRKDRHFQKNSGNRCVTNGHGMTMSPGRMTWLESLSNCTLPDEDSIQNLVDKQLRGWVGGIYSNSQWMIHQGCYSLDSNSESMHSIGVHDIKKLTPALCSEKCKMISYFALKYNWCVCLNSLYNLEDADSSKCTYKCLGSNKYVCGERSHYTVYKHSTE